MKVLVINWRDIKNPEAGGAEVHIDEILKRKPKNWTVDFVCAKYKGCKEIEKIHGYTVYRIPNNFLFNFTFRKYWNKKFKYNNYDLIIDDISKIPLATPRYITNIPIIAIQHHVHDKALFKELPFYLAVYVFLMERYYLTFYKNTPTIVMAQSNKNELESKYQYKKVIISPTGIDIDFIRKSKKFKKNYYPTLIYFGRLKKYKRIDHILKAFSIVKKAIPEVKLWIGGKGEQESNLKMLARRLKIDKDVSFFGSVSDRKKIELLKRAWVYVIASEKEGWGLTVIEANAVGVPAVGYNVEGLRDSIKEGYSGFLVENNNINLFAKKVAYLLDDNKLLKKMSDQANKWASNFSWDNTAKDFYRIANSILIKKPEGELF